MYNIISKYRIVKAILIAGIFIATLSSSMAQNIRGTVVDDSGVPIEFATIICVSDQDGSIIASGLTNSDGRFVFEKINSRTDSLLLKVSCLGFVPWQNKISRKSSVLDSIILTSSVKELGEVVVEARKRAMSFRNGTLSVHVKKLGLTTETAADVIKRLPGVELRENGDVLVGGSPAMIVVNGVKQRMNSNVIKSYLSSMPVGDLEQINVRMSALAEDRLNSSGGAIEIITKKNVVDGYSFSNTTQADFGRKETYRAGDYVNFAGRIKSLSGNAVVGYQKRVSFTERNEYSNKSTYTDPDLNTGTRYNTDAYYGVINLSWQPKSLRGGINIFTSYNLDDRLDHTDEKYNDRAGSVGSTLRRSYDGLADLLSTNVEYKSADSLRHQFHVSYGLLLGMDRNKQEVIGEPKIEYNVDRKLHGNQHTFNGDYIFKKEKLRVKLGSELSIARLNQDNTTNQSFSAFKMDETILGLYGSTDIQLRKNVSLYLGLRGEFSENKFPYMSDPYRVWNTMPMLSIDWQVNPNYTSSLSFSLKTNRPGYFDLAPGIYYQTKDRYEVGNPDLRPSSLYKIKTTHFLYKFVMLTLGLGYEKDSWGSVYGLDKDGLMYTKPLNYADQLYLYGDLSLPFQFFKNKFSGNINLHTQVVKNNNLASEVKDMVLYGGDNWFGRGNIYLSYKPTEQIGFWLYTEYRGRMRDLQMAYDAYGSVDLGFQYAFGKDRRWTLGLSLEDAFNTVEKGSTYKYGDKMLYYKTNPTSQRLLFKLNYRISRNSQTIRVTRNENDTSRFAK
ncbi:outer membrane beta-barrel family protein [Porphyromonas pogonae]|uniref:outer membrane beta-barrel family protein n=1 Tax=Porphyromonas pogonae TaxID=867595 RepID=UPI002E784C5E|nr:outer membrane beta-barrel family protein [Porphyromonas pogonae]